MTQQFNQPQVGSQVRVTTRFPEIYYWATEPWKDTVYQGTVGRPDKSVPEGSFLLLTPSDRQMPTRVISLARVIALEYSDGSAVGKSRAKDDVKVWQVSGSRGSVYTVTQRGSELSCTCPGFSFRKTCKHTTKSKT